ncbi:MAG: radical SAM family heme chaperone HemW [Candidatus Eremiobacteraeota bacterium]|nr:radical SAM family heme chaperone HemW [Candidatus Eremiobacteraeota bacterium]
MTPHRPGSRPNWLQRSHDGGLGCYVHLPFCDRICPYCDFAVVQLKEQRVERYLDALCKEIESYAGERAGLQTLYFGGGTPSALQPAQLARLASLTFSTFQTKPGTLEFTLEANPARNSKDLVDWVAAGVNRLSIGVQSLRDDELHSLGRDHSAAQAIAFYEAARQAGLQNISMDFIAGVPGQRVETLRSSLRRAAELGVDHVSVYGLTIEAGTPYAVWHERDAKAFPDDDAVAELLESAHDLLVAQGYEHYELSNFARPGFESAHNYGYWRQRDCAAFGMSAAGYDKGARYRNLRDHDAYCAALENSASARADTEVLSAAERLGEAAMLALRTAMGIGYADFQRRFSADARRVFARALKKCMDAGLLEADETGARLTSRGRLLANSACAEFLIPELMTATT